MISIRLMRASVETLSSGGTELGCVGVVMAGRRWRCLECRLCMANPPPRLWVGGPLRRRVRWGISLIGNGIVGSGILAGAFAGDARRGVDLVA